MDEPENKKSDETESEARLTIFDASIITLNDLNFSIRELKEPAEKKRSKSMKRRNVCHDVEI